jgi:hypothetical protein
MIFLHGIRIGAGYPQEVVIKSTIGAFKKLIDIDDWSVSKIV